MMKSQKSFPFVKMVRKKNKKKHGAIATPFKGYRHAYMVLLLFYTMKQLYQSTICLPG